MIKTGSRTSDTRLLINGGDSMDVAINAQVPNFGIYNQLVQNEVSGLVIAPDDDSVSIASQIEAIRMSVLDDYWSGQIQKPFLEPRSQLISTSYVYPNPTGDFCMLYIGADFKVGDNLDIQILGTKGDVLSSEKITVDENRIFPIRLESFPKGLILINLSKASKSVTLKITKK